MGVRLPPPASDAGEPDGSPAGPSFAAAHGPAAPGLPAGGAGLRPPTFLHGSSPRCRTSVRHLLFVGQSRCPTEVGHLGWRIHSTAPMASTEHVPSFAHLEFDTPLYRTAIAQFDQAVPHAD